MAWPLTIDGVTCMRAVAAPGATSSMVIPSDRDATSSAYMRSAARCASSCASPGGSAVTRAVSGGAPPGDSDGRVRGLLAQQVFQRVGGHRPGEEEALTQLAGQLLQ